jgi:hypothetical protein
VDTASVIGSTAAVVEVMEVVKGFGVGSLSNLDGLLVLNSGTSSISIPVNADSTVIQGALLSLGLGATSVTRSTTGVLGGYTWSVTFDELLASSTVSMTSNIEESTTKGVPSSFINVLKQSSATGPIAGGVFTLQNNLHGELKSENLSTNSSSSDIVTALSTVTGLSEKLIAVKSTSTYGGGVTWSIRFYSFPGHVSQLSRNMITPILLGVSLNAAVTITAIDAGKLLLIYICNFHVFSHLLLIYIFKLHWICRSLCRRTQTYYSIYFHLKFGWFFQSWVSTVVIKVCLVFWWYIALISSFSTVTRVCSHNKWR